VTLIKLELDHTGLAEVLKANCRELVDDAADAIAAAVRAQRPDVEEVEVEHQTSDRARANVVVKDPRAAGWQARDGLLTRAASARGVEVRSK
jgi:hypothetical protein